MFIFVGKSVCIVSAAAYNCCLKVHGQHETGSDDASSIYQATLRTRAFKRRNRVSFSQ